MVLRQARNIDDTLCVSDRCPNLYVTHNILSNIILDPIILSAVSKQKSYGKRYPEWIEPKRLARHTPLWMRIVFVFHKEDIISGVDYVTVHPM